jgi:hypothetical protein
VSSLDRRHYYVSETETRCGRVELAELADPTDDRAVIVRGERCGTCCALGVPVRGVVVATRRPRRAA